MVDMDVVKQFLTTKTKNLLVHSVHLKNDDEVPRQLSLSLSYPLFLPSNLKTAPRKGPEPALTAYWQSAMSLHHGRCWIKLNIHCSPHSIISNANVCIRVRRVRVARRLDCLLKVLPRQKQRLNYDQ